MAIKTKPEISIITPASNVIPVGKLKEGDAFTFVNEESDGSGNLQTIAKHQIQGIFLGRGKLPGFVKILKLDYPSGIVDDYYDDLLAIKLKIEKVTLSVA